MSLARQVYLLSAALPKSETYGLLAQIRRAAVSVPSNIAEGHGRLTDLQFRHFLGNARGSLYELRTQIELATNLGYLDNQSAMKLQDQSSEVARLINGLLASLSRHEQASAAIVNSASSANPAAKRLRA
jgi:four helix bundle protein